MHYRLTPQQREKVEVAVFGVTKAMTSAWVDLDEDEREQFFRELVVSAASLVEEYEEDGQQDA